MSLLLDVQDLRLTLPSREHSFSPVDGVSFSLSPGEALGLVGESGCGKSLTALSLLRLVPEGSGISGRALFEGQNLLQLPDEAMRQVRGSRLAMIFQEPMTCLNSLLRIGDQVSEAILIHEKVSRREAEERSIALLKQVGIPIPERRARDFPHQLSGGMRQRTMIAMALVLKPSLLIADEPTTALDVTIQAQILDLLGSLQQEYGMAVLFISHDMGVVSRVAGRVAVMYAGRIVEQGKVDEVLRHPRHPYTKGLLSSRPELGRKGLSGIAGTVPDPKRFPPACRFHPRCPIVEDVCREKEPDLSEVSSGHLSRCWKAETLKA